MYQFYFTPHPPVSCTELCTHEYYLWEIVLQLSLSHWCQYREIMCKIMKLGTGCTLHASFWVHHCSKRVQRAWVQLHSGQDKVYTNSLLLKAKVKRRVTKCSACFVVWTNAPYVLQCELRQNPQKQTNWNISWYGKSSQHVYTLDGR